ncbi:MAG TPA: ABC transporter substrate-binding protein [Holophagaceae bacterium]|jgi:PAS domain S-box-containing protein|nr:ABC transporter substrate-binding protein [Holophagaceae bacterium]
MRRFGPPARFWMLLGFLGLLAAAPPGAVLPATRRQVAIQLKWYPQFQFAGYYAAEHQGFYRAEGLDVSLKSGEQGIDPVAEVVSGRAQFGVADPDLLLARAQGKPVVVLAAVFQHSPYILLTRDKDHLARPSDLIGKTLMGQSDQGETQLRAMLLAEGIDPGKVTFLPHSWNLQDLVSGKVDGMSAYLTVEPYQLQKLGVSPGIMRPSDYGIDFYGDCLFTTEDEIRDHPDEVEAVLRATRAGWMEAMRDPGQVIPWILEQPGVRDRGIGLDNLAYEARAMQPMVLADIIPVGHINPDRWQRILSAYQTLGLLPPDMKLDRFLYTPATAGIPRRILRWILIALIALLGASVAAFAWITFLRRVVRARTRELHREKEQLQLAQHAADQAHDFISWVDEEGRYLYGNRTLLDLYGLTLDSLRQQRVWDRSPRMNEKRWREIWRTLSHSGTRLADASLIRNDGTEVPVEILSTLVEAGNMRVACNIARDLTDFQRAERERKEQEQQLALVLDGTGVGYWDWKIPTGVLELDTTVDRLLRYGAGELPRLISTWFDHLHPEDRDQTFNILQPFLDGDAGIYDTEFRLSRKDGSWLWVHVRGRVTGFAPDGKAGRIQGIVQDIDARKRAEEGLRQAQRLDSLGLMAGGIAHDFNNLLTAVLGNLSLARLGLPEDSRSADHIRKAEQAVQQAASLTRQLLAYSGKGRLTVGPIDLNAMVSEMRDLLEVGLTKDIVLETRIAPEAPFIEGDSTQVQQVLLNLITNAAEAIGSKPGRIEVTTGMAELGKDPAPRLPGGDPLPPGPYAVLEVSDTGAGMPPETVARIFDPFFTTKATGRGLGLAALLGIMRGHRGGLLIESEPGKGTTFGLYFPRRATVPLPQGVVASAPGDELGGEVLIADDEPGVLEAGQALLESLGFTVVTAEDGEAAIARFLEHVDRLRLVIVDQTMPRMSGADAFRAMRRLRPGLPVILSSGFSEEEVGDTLQAEGLDGFLQKPYRLADLERVVRKVLSR